MKEGWKMVKLGEVCEIINGKNQKEVISSDGLFPILGSGGNVMGYATDYLCPAGTIIIGRKGSINNPLYIETPFWNVDTAFGFNAKDNYNRKLLYYYCLSFDFEKLNKGTTLPSLVKSDLLQIELPLPPLEEQHRIVSILDASFEKIDALKKNAEENLKNAKALLQQVLAQELKPKEGWEKYKLENICTNIVDCPHSTPKKNDEITNYPCIRTSELRNGKIYWDSMQYLDKDEYEKRVVRLIPKAGDIVYGREGTFGDAVLLPDGYNFSLGQRTMLLRPDTTIVSSDFLLITMISPYVYKQAKDKNSGCGVGHVNVKDIKKFTIFLPDNISEQHRIVQILDTLSEKCRRLEQIAQQTIRKCDALKQSILRQAFSGEL